MILQKNTSLSSQIGRMPKRYITSLHTFSHKNIKFGSLHVISAFRDLQMDTLHRPENYRFQATSSIRQFQARCFSSRSRDSKFQLDGLAFSISPENALAKFDKWARQDQGLKYLLSWSSVRIAAAYVPVWSFDVNLRFQISNNQSWMPSMFAEAYPNQSTIYVSGLSVYSGHSYQRKLLNPLHNTTLIFFGDQAQPFGNWMLRDMKLSNGAVLTVFPDPWNATKSHAQEILRQDLTSIAQMEDQTAKLKMQLVSARRVYLPTYVVEYKILGIEYQAFLSGCDDGADVSGADHQVWKNNGQSLFQLPSIFQGATSAAQWGSRVLGFRGIAAVLSVVVQLVGSVAIRIIARIPILTVLGSVVIAFRKVLYPWIDHRYSKAEWERQREDEARGRSFSASADDFEDARGIARRYYEQNKSRILRTFSGKHKHESGDYDWYKEWEEWARRQYQEQSTYREQHQQQNHQQGSNNQRTRRATATKSDYKWDFDPNDPYSVLGIRRGATKSEVSAAFRREMLKHHPDTQAGASDAAKQRAEARSKYITEAYRKIKTEMK
jgi:DnaJ domain